MEKVWVEIQLPVALKVHGLRILRNGTTVTLKIFFKYEYELVKSPAEHFSGPIDLEEENYAPDVEDPKMKVTTIMLTSDLGLKEGPDIEKNPMHFKDNPDEFADAFARAWFKLLHRDMGPKSRYLGPEVPEKENLARSSA
ncbi:MAG: hypothetical protein CM15mP12_6540 [Gammaproteobacteria bacterium]|nr:MAG: hypothetical protein CM15mP12_6540 [Gammaproteobacteria bacterium]